MVLKKLFEREIVYTSILYKIIFCFMSVNTMFEHGLKIMSM